MKGPLNEQVYKAAMRDAKAAIARAAEANEVLVGVLVEVLQAEPEVARERHIADLIKPLMDSDLFDILVMWAVLMLERAEAVRDGS